MRLLGHPELLNQADKHYLVRSDIRDEATAGWLPGRNIQLPKELDAGESHRVSFRVADDLQRWRRLGRVKSVVLRVRFREILPNYDRVEIHLNGQELPDSILRKVDMTYRLVDQHSSAHSITPYGYAYDFHLDPEHYPRSVSQPVEDQAPQARPPHRRTPGPGAGRLPHRVSTPSTLRRPTHRILKTS